MLPTIGYGKKRIEEVFKHTPDPLQESTKKFIKITLNKDLNFFADFQQFRKLSKLPKIKKKKIAEYPINIHTVKVRMYGTESKLATTLRAVKSNKAIEGTFLTREHHLIDKLDEKAKSLKFININIGDCFDRNRVIKHDR